MKKFTVLLVRPEYFSGDRKSIVDDTYLALVRAKDEEDAIRKGRQEAFEADCQDASDESPEAEEAVREAIKPVDYDVLFVFKGHAEVLLYGWERGCNDLDRGSHER